MSPVFQRLFMQAVKREHPKLVAAHAIAFHVSEHPAVNTLELARAATGIVEAATSFDERLRLLVDRHRIRRPKAKLACPLCDQECCGAAELRLPYKPTASGLMVYILSGQPLPDFET